jgi:hypothetical protein
MRILMSVAVLVGGLLLGRLPTHPAHRLIVAG